MTSRESFKVNFGYDEVERYQCQKSKDTDVLLTVDTLLTSKDRETLCDQEQG